MLLRTKSKPRGPRERRLLLRATVVGTGALVAACSGNNDVIGSSDAATDQGRVGLGVMEGGGGLMVDAGLVVNDAGSDAHQVGLGPFDGGGGVVVDAGIVVDDAGSDVVLVGIGPVDGGSDVVQVGIGPLEGGSD